MKFVKNVEENVHKYSAAHFKCSKQRDRRVFLLNEVLLTERNIGTVQNGQFGVNITTELTNMQLHLTIMASSGVCFD